MISYHLISNTLIVQSNGKHFQITSQEKNWESCLELLKENKLEELVKKLDTKTSILSAGFDILDGLIHYKGEALPKLLSERILDFQRQELPFDALLKFWENLKSNPSYRARRDLYSFLSHNNHPITSDGCFIAYRKVRSDFKDIHSGTFDNSVGKICEMPREEVDDDPNNTCSSGLHFGAWDYVKDFGSSLGHILEVKVNPRDVVSIPTDYNNMKGRCCKFEVLAVCEAPCKETLVEVPEYEEDYEEDEVDEDEDFWGYDWDEDE